MQILETPRLTLRELTPADVELLHRVTGDPAAMRFYKKVLSLEETAQNIEKQRTRYAQFGYGHWAVERKSDGEFIGTCGLIPFLPLAQPAIAVGYRLVPNFWHQGYATEAARGCCKLGFEKYQPAHILAVIRPGNTPSERVAQRLGMELWQTVVYEEQLHNLWRIAREQWMD